MSCAATDMQRPASAIQCRRPAFDSGLLFDGDAINMRLQVGPFSKSIFASDHLLRVMQLWASLPGETFRRVALKTGHRVPVIRSQRTQKILRSLFLLFQ